MRLWDWDNSVCSYLEIFVTVLIAICCRPLEVVTDFLICNYSVYLTLGESSPTKF